MTATIAFGYLVRGDISEQAALEAGQRAQKLGAHVNVRIHTFRGKATGQYEAQASTDLERYAAVLRPTVEEALHAALDEVPVWSEAEIVQIVNQTPGMEVRRA